MTMLQALIDGFWVVYYRWAMNALHPAHPDAAHVVLMHAMHNAQLERFLQGVAPSRLVPTPSLRAGRIRGGTPR